MNQFFRILMTGTLVAALAISLAACNDDKEPTQNKDNTDQIVKPGTNSGNTGDENNTNVSVGKLEAATLETYLRSYRVSFEMVARENAGFNTFGWDTGDNAGAAPSGYTYTNATKDAGDRVRNSYDEGDMNLNGIMDNGENWTGRKVYTETWAGVYTLDNPANPDDKSAYNALEHAINANLDPKFQIELSYDGTFTTLAADPWGTNFHGMFITNALEDKTDRGALIILSDGPNKTDNAKVNIAKGVLSFTGNTDDFYLSTIYTYKNGYGEVVSDMKLPTVTENNDNEVDNNIGNVENNNNNNNSNDDNQSMQDKIEVVDIDWSKLVTIDFGKWNGYATPTLTVNYNYFETKILSKNVQLFLENETSYGITRVIQSECNNWFTVEFAEDYQRLSNGDKIKVKIVLNDAFTRNGMLFETFCQKLGFNFTETVEVTVAGLQTDFMALNFLEEMLPYVRYKYANGYGETIGVSIPYDFSYNVGDIYVVYSNGYNAVKIIYNNEKLATIYIDVNSEGKECLKQGDTINIYFAAYDLSDQALQTLSDLGYIIPYDIMHDDYREVCGIEIKVPDLGKYITNSKQITPEISDKIVEKLNDYDNSYVSKKGEYEKVYFVKLKPGVESQHNVSTFVVTVFQASAWRESGYTYEAFYGMQIQPDGTIVYDSVSPSNDFYNSIQEIFEQDLKDVEIIELIYEQPLES